MLHDAERTSGLQHLVEGGEDLIFYSIPDPAVHVAEGEHQVDGTRGTQLYRFGRRELRDARPPEGLGLRLETCEHRLVETGLIVGTIGQRDVVAGGDVLALLAHIGGDDLAVPEAAGQGFEHGHVPLEPEELEGREGMSGRVAGDVFGAPLRTDHERGKRGSIQGRNDLGRTRGGLRTASGVRPSVGTGRAGREAGREHHQHGHAQKISETVVGVELHGILMSSSFGDSFVRSFVRSICRPVRLSARERSSVPGRRTRGPSRPRGCGPASLRAARERREASA